jgi:uncharacterized protein
MSSPRYLPEALPVPEVNEANRAFFTSGELRVQTCRSCRIEQHPPVEICSQCGGFEFDYPASRTSGTVSSYTIVHHPTHPALTDAVPYNVVIVELDDHPGLRVVGNLVGAMDERPVIGQRVVAGWTTPIKRDGQDPVRLLQWHPAPRG